MKKFVRQLCLAGILFTVLSTPVSAGKEDLLKKCIDANDQGKHLDALYLCKQALAEDSSYIDALYWSGFAQIKLGAYEYAITALSKVLQLQPLHIDAWSLRADAYRRSGNLEQALADANRALEIDSKYAAGYLTRAVILRQLQRYPEALADNTLAIELDPNFAAAYRSRGLVNRQLQLYPEALADFSLAIELDPKDAATYTNRGNIYGILQRYPEAIVDFTLAIELDPTLTTAYRNRGLSYTRLQRYPEALADYTWVIALEQDAKTYAIRGNIYGLTKRYAEAESDCRANLALTNAGQASPSVIINLAQALELQGKKKEALQWYEKFLSLVPANKNDEETAKARARMKGDWSSYNSWL